MPSRPPSRPHRVYHPNGQSSENWVLSLITLWLAFAMPVLLVAFFQTDNVIFIYGVKIAMGCFVLAKLIPIGAYIGRFDFSSPLLWMALLFLALLLSCGFAFYENPGPIGISKLRSAVSTTVWCSGIWVAWAYLRDMRSVTRLVRWIDLAGILISFSTIAALVARNLGYDFGEVHGGGSSDMRVFGPLGDNGPFVILFSLFYSFLRRKWHWAALHSAALLLSVTRGVVVCCAAALLFYVATLLWFDRGASTWRRLRRLFFQLIGVGTFCVLILTTTSYGQFLLARFGGKEELIYENKMGGRLANIEFAWNLFSEKWFFGYGFNGYAENISAVYSIVMADAEKGAAAGFASNSTNQLLQTAVDGGLLSVVLFLAMVTTACFRGFRIIQLSPPEFRAQSYALGMYAAAILVGLQSAIYFYDLSSSGYYVFLVVGLIEATWAILSRQDQSRPPGRNSLA